MDQITKLGGVLLSWPVVVLVIVLIFRRELTELLKRLQKFSKGKDGWQADFGDREKDIRSFPDIPPADGAPGKAAVEGGRKPTPDTVLNEEDLVAALTSIPELSGEEASVREHARELTMTLFRNGIISRDQLNRLVASRDILDTLREIYMTELKRPRERALDIFAMPHWGAPLFVYGMRADMIDRVRSAVRQSPEYREMH